MSSSADLRMSRARLYVLVDGFEQDMRQIVEQQLLEFQSETELLSNLEYNAAKQRQSLDENGDDVSVIHYLDLQPCFEILVRNKELLPVELRAEILENIQGVQNLIPIRHRVMHGRPLNAEDPRTALLLLHGFRSKYWGQTVSTIERLKKDATWEPYFEKVPVPFERTLHNLPEVDYDETTFIGRKVESQKLLSELKRRRENVVTVTGEGGIGKTTLALDIAYQLLDSDDNPYEAILWVSLKTEHLTAYGVEELRNAIRGIDETVAEIGRGIDLDFVGSLDDLSAALQDIECLIIIDNLESAQGDEVVKMYDTLPSSVNYLFTSRLGIGQIERRFPLPPLSSEESKLLFRRFASARGQKKLSGLSEKTLDKVVEQLRYSPLAIRWYVLSSEAGKVPLDTLRDQRELLDFCVKNVYDGLTDNSRAVLTILRALDRSIGFDEFAILTDMLIDELRIVTQELTQGSLVVVESESAGLIAGRLALTPTARMFVKRPDHNGTFIAEVLQRERQFRASIEGRASGQTDRIDLERVIPRDSNDHPAMYLLQRAVRFAKSRQYAKSHVDIERARSFIPEYSEVYRISGYVYELEDHFATAVSEYQTALSYVVEPKVRAIIDYSLASVFAKKLHDSELALPHARSAYDALPCGDTEFLLGRVLIWTGNFRDGQELLEKFLDSTTENHKRIVETVLVDSWARWADREFSSRDFRQAIEKSSAGFHSGLHLVEKGNPGDKLLSVMAECSIVYLRSLQRVDDKLSEVDERMLQKVVKFAQGNSSLINPRKARVFAEVLSGVAEMISSSHRIHGTLISAVNSLNSPGFPPGARAPSARRT